MHCTLENIVLILEEAFKYLSKIEGKNIILAVGNTGCGKSTMLTSLMYGPAGPHWGHSHSVVIWAF